MESGEKELRKAFEETTIRNVQACVDHGNNTREIVNKFGEAIKRLENMVLAQAELLEEQKRQLSLVQQKLYAGGTV